MDQLLEDLVPPVVRPYVGWVAGMDWPDGSEERIFRASGFAKGIAAKIGDVADLGDLTHDNVVKLFDGIAAENFGKYWKQFTQADPQFLPKLCKSCDELAEALN